MLYSRLITRLLSYLELKHFKLYALVLFERFPFLPASNRLFVWKVSINQTIPCRKTQVLEKSKVKPRKLAPTNNSFILPYTYFEAYIQLQFWIGATESNLNLQCSLELGYNTESQTGFYTPKLMSQSASAPEMLSDL